MMTNKEAIIFLSKVKQILLQDNSWLESTKTPITESFDMAIAALREMQKRESMDLIERQDALDALEKIGWIETKADKEYAIQLFTDLPPAQPKQKKGKWIDEHCSECGCYVYHGDVRNFCPKCGADMREDEG